jgi:glucose-6-phosphate 1-dehydrogenase
MLQNHLLQILTMVAMEDPTRYTAENMRNEKMKVLAAIPVPTPEAARKAALGRYSGYLAEPGVPATSKTPTFAAVRLEVENRRWRGVPFYLRSGKGLSQRYSEVMIQFRCPSHLMFPLPPGESLRCNHITLVIQPNEGISINFQTKVPDVDGVHLRPRDLAFDYKRSYADKALPEAYERLLLDAIQGDASLFMRADEIERAWQIMDPIIAASEAPDAPQPEEYAVGSAGPKSADALLAAEGREWQPIG